MPPLAGFTGKWFILVNVTRSTEPIVYVGTAVFLLNSLLSLGYYLPLIATLFSSPQTEQNEAARIPISLWMVTPLVILGGLVIAIGLYPEPWLDGMVGAGVYLMSSGR